MDGRNRSEIRNCKRLEYRMTGWRKLRRQGTIIVEDDWMQGTEKNENYKQEMRKKANLFLWRGEGGDDEEREIAYSVQRRR